MTQTTDPTAVAASIEVNAPVQRAFEVFTRDFGALRALSARSAADRLRLGGQYADAGDLVVVDALGKPVRPEWYSNRFRQLCVEAGVEVITLHNVRHSLAFWLHREGVTPADAAALLGHTVEVHLSTYLPHSGSTGIAAAAHTLGRAHRLGSCRTSPGFERTPCLPAKGTGPMGMPAPDVRNL